MQLTKPVDWVSETNFVIDGLEFVGDLQSYAERTTRDRVVILNQGRIVADGSVSDVARRAPAPRRGRVRVPGNHAAVARQVLAAVDGVVSVHSSDQPGELAIEVAAEVTGEAASERMLGALLAAGVAVVSFDIEAGRLSDAYLQLTARS